MITIYKRTITEIMNVCINKFRLTVISTMMLVFATTAFVVSAQSDDLLAPGYPDRYTVVKGDTLWDISRKFLNDPWRWAEVWQGNPQVENPDLIYPGDVLVLTYVDGRPVIRSLRRETVKLSPKARAESYEDAIPPIDPRAISAYINSPLVTDEDELENAGYIVDGLAGHLLMGKYDQFYARNIEDQEADEYRVFRPGRAFVHPVTEESLGLEAEHLGDALMLKKGDTSRLSLLKAHKDVSIKDRLRPVYKKENLPFFYPTAPENDDIRGYILPELNQVTELGALSIVAISLGEREGVKPGTVFRIRSHSVEKEDPMTGKDYFIPEETIGLLMVFRSFEKMSYAIITNTNREVRANDIVVSPNFDDSVDTSKPKED